MSTEHGPGLTTRSHPGPILPAPDDGDVITLVDERPIASAGRIGRYWVLRAIGQGGMGRVYEAFDPQLERKVALKVVRSRVRSRGGLERLVREAHALARLTHPNVVAVYEAGHAGDEAFIAMEYVDGDHLRRWCERRSAAERFEAWLQAGRGLEAAHRAGIVHRDFKPENVLVGRDGRVRVADFGLAHAPAGDRDRLDVDWAGVRDRGDRAARRLTATGAVLGTPGYMAPEQFAGGSIDARVDQFSFCVVGWELLFGVHPFPGDTSAERLARIESGRPVAGESDVPASREVAALLARGMRARADARHRDLETLLRALEATQHRAPASPPRRRWWWVASVAVVALAAPLLWTRPEPERPCQGAEAQIDPVWNRDRSEVVRQALAAVEHPFAESASRIVPERLDDYREAWIEAHRDACEATAIRREQSERVMDLRMACLREQLSALRAAVQVFESADPQTVHSSTNVLEKLAQAAESCGDIRALEARQALEGDPASPPELRDALARIRVLAEAGHTEQALAIVEDHAQLGTSARDKAYIGSYRASLYSRLARIHDAKDEQERAFRSALQSQDEEVIVFVAAAMANRLGLLDNERGEARRLIELADALASGPRGFPRLQAQVASAYGAFYFNIGQFAQAADSYRKALSIEEQEAMAETASIASLHSNIGLALSNLSQYDDALTELEIAEKILLKRYGPSHPGMANILHYRAGVYHGQHRYIEGIELDRQAIRLKSHPSDPIAARSLCNIGAAYAKLGRLQEAIRILQECLDLQLASGGAKALGALSTRAGLAELRYASAPSSETIAEIEQVTRDTTSILDRSDPRQIEVRLWEVSVFARGREWSRAESAATALEAVLATPQVSPQTRAATFDALARGLQPGRPALARKYAELHKVQMGHIDDENGSTGM